MILLSEKNKHKSFIVKEIPVKISGEFLIPTDIDKIVKDLESMEILGKTGTKKFSNVVYWEWKNKVIRLHLYGEYGLIEKKVKSPENHSEDNIWILKKIIPVGDFHSAKTDVLPIIKREVIKASKSEKEDWSESFRINSITKKLKEALVQYLPKMWFATEKINIKNLGPKRRIIYVPLVGMGVGHTDNQRLYQIMFDIYIDDNNILNVIEGNIEGSLHGGEWSIGPSDLIAKFAPWQSEEEIVDAIAEFAGRY
jgi:hypothetical protein